MVALSVTDAGQHRLLGPVDFEMTGPGLDGALALIRSRLVGAGRVIMVCGVRLIILPTTAELYAGFAIRRFGIVTGSTSD